jgi:hypothetical protein
VTCDPFRSAKIQRAGADLRNPVGSRVKPRLADGSYLNISTLAFYEGDLYAANTRGIYKLPQGDLAKPFEPVCAFPQNSDVSLLPATFLVGPSRIGFAVSPRGFFVPLKNQDRSALALVRGSDCAVQQLTA